jgi:hypothetical protein
VRVLEALLPSIVMVTVFIALIVTVVRHSDGVRSDGRSGRSADGGRLAAGPAPQEERRDGGDVAP